MTILRNKLMKYCLLILLMAPALAQAYISSENFDTNWIPSLPWGSAQSGTNHVTGWTASGTWLSYVAGFESPSNAANINTGTGWVQSPVFSNGIGAVTFYANSGSASKTGTGVVEVCTDESTWTTNGNLYIITGGTFLSLTNIVNTNVPIRIRFRRLSAAANQFIVDTINISAYPPSLSITNISTSPNRPADYDPVTITAGVGVQGLKDSLWVTNYWRQWPVTSWTAIAMATNASGNFETITPVPGKPIGAIIEYFLGVTCISDGTPYSTNSATQSYVVRPQSGFTNMLVTDQINTNLLIGANYFWQNVVTLSNARNNSRR